MSRTKRDRAKAGFPGQHEGEEVIIVERQFPIVLRKPLLLGMAIVLVGLIPWAVAMYNDYGWLAGTYWWLLAWFLVLLFIWVRAWVGWYYSVYVLTTSRIMIVKQSGFFGRDVVDLTLNNIQSVNYSVSGFMAALFGFGMVTIETLAGSKPLKLRLVSRPADMQKAITEAVTRFGLKK